MFSNGKWASWKTGFSNHPHLQRAVKSPVSFAVCTKTALSERAQLWLPSGVSARERSGTGRQRDKKGWREARGTPGISKVLQDLAKERRTNETNKNPFGASRNKTQERSSLFSVGANSFHLHTFQFPLHEVLQSCSLTHSPAHSGEKDPPVPVPLALPVTEIQVLPPWLLSRNTQQPGELSLRTGQWGFPKLLLDCDLRAPSSPAVFLRLTPFPDMKKGISG